MAEGYTADDAAGRGMDLLRFATAGSVDDGKSTLIGRLHEGEHMRVFPLRNWTELDIWHYIGREGIEIPSIYYAHQRRVFERGGMLFSESEFNPCREGETVTERQVRFRTVGDLTLTGCLESDADTIEKIIDEIAVARVTERGATRGDDKFSEAAMEDRKKEGYF